MENKQIAIKNMIKKEVVIAFPELKFKRTWQPEATIKVDIEVVKEGLFDRGFMVMLEKGILSIVEKADRVELGLEEEDGPDMVKLYSINEMMIILKSMPIDEFQTTVSEMTHEQTLTLTDLAIEHEIYDLNKAEILKKINGLDIAKAIQFNRSNKE